VGILRKLIELALLMLILATLLLLLLFELGLEACKLLPFLDSGVFLGFSLEQIYGSSPVTYNQILNIKPQDLRDLKFRDLSCSSQKSEMLIVSYLAASVYLSTRWDLEYLTIFSNCSGYSVLNTVKKYELSIYFPLAKRDGMYSDNKGSSL